MNKLQIVSALTDRKCSKFEEHPAFDLFIDELKDANLAPVTVEIGWYYFREGWEFGAAGAPHDE